MVQFDVTASRAAEFAINFRIPAWADGASIRVNGRKVDGGATPGTFASVRRAWKTGDRVELDLPMRNRLEAVDSKHPDTVGLLSGPLVLFAITSTMPQVTRRQLLAAEKTGPQEWKLEAQGATLRMLPFTSIREEQYTTYLNVGG